MRRQILSRSLLTVAAASSILAVTGGYANADSDAQGALNGSPHSADAHSPEADVPAGTHSYGATAESDTHGSPGVLSGNSVNIPVQAPVNVCGNSVDVAALLNAVSGNSCANGEVPATPVVPGPRHAKPPVTTPEVHTQLAETGASRGAVGAATGAGAALLLSGAMLYRRSTRTARIQRTYS
ncbi:chaplin [Streptomyces sp. NBC_01477]|uniref:chaplin n=1 Tax=Streptomyces sp. NBC_01477 TaxID=2976015 RepID=UPI002E31E620|nr:chaplin [Streptomyces sp. NBC_01477]